MYGGTRDSSSENNSCLSIFTCLCVVTTNAASSCRPSRWSRQTLADRICGCSASTDSISDSSTR